MCGEKAVSERRTQEWFARFHSGNFSVKDAPRSNRPVTEKVDEISQLMEQDRHASCQEMAEALNINHMTHYLKSAGYKKKFDVWLQYKLTRRDWPNITTMSGMFVTK